MFDDPNKALKELQSKLMAAEVPEEDIFAPPAEAPAFFPEPEEEEPATPTQNRQTKSALLAALLLLEVAALLGVLAWWLLW